LMSLLNRFYEPQRGRILIDGKDIKSFSLRELRRELGLIQQDAFIFSGSIEKNVSFGLDLSAQAQARIARLVRDTGFKLSGLEVLERGQNLSQGQKQLLAFARALAAEPSIWILDEATASVDTIAETAVSRILEDELKTETLFVIAHRLSTIRNADKIVVLNHGKKVEEGNHEELVRANALYARLYRYQLAGGSELHV
jgi:ATP-binding cassette subfamily B multidrug efflux pump